MSVILVVEDDAFLREMAVMTIQEWGYQIISASDVDEALIHLHSPQHIDGLFTDINLKKLAYGGCELAHKAIEFRPELRVLYTTGNVVDSKLTAMFVGGSKFLHKPYSDQQLQHSVEAMFAA